LQQPVSPIASSRRPHYLSVAESQQHGVSSQSERTNDSVSSSLFEQSSFDASEDFIVETAAEDGMMYVPPSRTVPAADQGAGAQWAAPAGAQYPEYADAGADAEVRELGRKAHTLRAKRTKRRSKSRTRGRSPSRKSRASTASVGAGAAGDAERERQRAVQVCSDCIATVLNQYLSLVTGNLADPSRFVRTCCE
jgi:hypothetical protein